MGSKEDTFKEVAIKSLGIVGSSSVVVGCIIGSGIFMNVSVTLEVTPNSVGLLIVYWILGGLISMLGGLCYAELGCTFTKAGGERTYLAETYGAAYGVTFTYLYTYLIKSTSVAAIAIACGTYITEMFLPSCQNVATIQKLIGCCMILIVMMLNCYSKYSATKTSIFFTTVKLFSLVFIIVIGWVVILKGQALDLSHPFTYEKSDMSKLGNTLLNIFWTMAGWNVLGALVGDMKNPKRDLPIVMPLSLLVVIVTYCMTIISYVAVLGYEEVMNSRAVAIHFAEKTIGKAGKIIPIFIACSTFGSLNSNVYSVSKIALTSGFNEEMPSVFSLVRRKERTPVVAIISMILVSFIFVPFDFYVIIQYCGFISWLFYFVVFSIIIYVRYCRKDLQSTFRVFILFPFFLQLVSLYIMFSLIFIEKLYVGCSIMVLLSIFLVILHKLPPKYRQSKKLTEYHESLKIFLMKNFDLVPAASFDIE